MDCVISSTAPSVFALKWKDALAPSLTVTGNITVEFPLVSIVTCLLRVLAGAVKPEPVSVTVKV